MKPLLFSYCALGMLTLSAPSEATSVNFSINHNSWEKYAENLKVLKLSEISEQVLSEISLGEHPDLAVQFSKGIQLPIHFFLKGDLVNLTEDPVASMNLGRLEIQQTFYARLVEGELILSIDLNEWKPFFEFITGNASAALSIQNQEPSISLGAEANRRI